MTVLERPEEIQRFKAAYRQGHQIATVNRALSTIRGAINWGRFQDPLLLTNSPFHRFGITIRTKEETKRDRRIGAEEEKALLDAALPINSDEHKRAGASMHDRIIGALNPQLRDRGTVRLSEVPPASPPGSASRAGRAQRRSRRGISAHRVWLLRRRLKAITENAPIAPAPNVPYSMIQSVNVR